MNVITLTSVRPDCARAAPGFPESRRPAMTDDRMTEDLMTRRQVASMFGVTSAAVASWARRGRLLEVRNEAGRPRYRRSDVEALFRSGMRRRVR
jgi:transposase